ncbi:hypothetical protein H7X87_01695 [Acetobacteraceae bacterium]|nr:hypothetical protein [Candidatus Parcubacteria bacterium]
MRNYIKRLQDEKTPHERRSFAVRVAGALTAVIFVGWLATFGMRLSNDEKAIAENTQSNQTASLGSLIKSAPNFLYSATTTER